MVDAGVEAVAAVVLAAMPVVETSSVVSAPEPVDGTVVAGEEEVVAGAVVTGGAVTGVVGSPVPPENHT